MRYFLSVAYMGTRYAGFQVQDGQETIQSQVTKALETLFRVPFSLTGSSRTDAGVHAEENYFHFDTDHQLTLKHQYNLNAILPSDIAIKGIYRVGETAHCRFDAVERKYKYLIHNKKDPFLTQRSWLYPYPLDRIVLNRLSEVLLTYTDFTSFSKRNTQVYTYNCEIREASWEDLVGGGLGFHISSNRFLRGMIRGIVGTMIRIARAGVTIEEAEELFRNIIEAKDCSRADFTTPAYGLYLMEVRYPEGMMQALSE